MQVFTENAKDEQNKAAAKEKFTRFFNLLDEVVERHKFVRVLEDDPRARREIEDETVTLVVPSFRLFTHKQMDKEFSKSVSIIGFSSF
jgi:exocyst complex protein 7